MNRTNFRAYFGSMLCFALCSIATEHARGAVVEYSGGHGDVGLAFEGSELELHYHFGAGAVLDGVEITGDEEYDPDGIYVRVPDIVQQTLSGPVSFLGVGAGDTIWRLPASNPNSNAVPYLGLAGEELDPAVFSSASYQMTGFSGPGNFALWTSDGVNTTVFMQTVDGIDGTDLYNLAVGGHDHANWGFTAEGIYDITFTAFASGTAGSFDDVGTLRFVVGSSTAVPEPGTILALGLCSAGVAMAHRRRQRFAKKAV